MIKAAAVLALFAGAFAGFSAAKKLKTRETSLEKLLQFLLVLKLSLEYGGKPLGGLLRELEQREETKANSFPGMLTAELQNGAALPQAWKTASLAEKGTIGSEGTALLLRLGALIGTTDKPGQSELLSSELRRLDQLYQSAKEKRERCAPLYRAVGAFAGFAVFILAV